MSAPAVEMIGISKRFGPVEALSEIDLRVEAGTTHAIVGENGAGKTTLMRILYGALRPDNGEIRVEGKPVQFRRAADGIAAGIGMVSQHYAIIPELDALQNLMLGAEPGLWLDRPANEARAQALAETMGFAFDWRAEARRLSPAAAQKLEILKLLWREARIMILDEPTAMLSPADSDALFESLHALAAKGATILLVTHRLPEVIAHAQHVTVLRGGRCVAGKPVGQTGPAELAEMIVGHAVEPVRRPPLAYGEPRLEVRDLRVKGRRGDEALKSVSLTLRQGEVVGLAGVDGSGQRELFWALSGALRAEGGTIRLLGEDVTTRSPRARIEAGLRLIPEDRHEEGVVEDWSLVDNARIGLQRLSGLHSDSPTALAERVAARFSTRHGGLNMPMRSLSGGNQQRFVAARALAVQPRLILAFQPARGLDIEATRQVYAALREEAARGAAALVVSFDLDELLEHCDRVAAMRSGQIFEPEPGQETDRTTIGRLMVGAGAAAEAGAA